MYMDTGNLLRLSFPKMSLVQLCHSARDKHFHIIKARLKHLHPNTRAVIQPFKQFFFWNCSRLSSWWFQPTPLKKYESNWIISPGFGVKNKHNHFENTTLLPSAAPWAWAFVVAFFFSSWQPRCTKHLAAKPEDTTDLACQASGVFWTRVLTVGVCHLKLISLQTIGRNPKPSSRDNSYLDQFCGVFLNSHVTCRWLWWTEFWLHKNFDVHWSRVDWENETWESCWELPWDSLSF